VNPAKDYPSPRGSVTSAPTATDTASTADTAAAIDTATARDAATAGVVDSLRREAATGGDDAKLQLAQKCTAPAFKVCVLAKV
jgi:hypothetical protein